MVWRTNAQVHAWLQLDLRSSFRVIKVKTNIYIKTSMLKKFSILKVRFESGPIGAQDVEIRVTDTSVQNNQVYLHNFRIL